MPPGRRRVSTRHAGVRRRSARATGRSGWIVEASPEVPAGDGRPGLPGGGDALHFGGFGKVFERPGALHGGADAEVGRRQDVGAAEGEHEEHLGGPDADAFDAGEVFNYGGVVELGEGFEDDGAAAGVFGQFADVERFLRGESQAAHALGAEFHDSGGRDHFFSRRRVEAAEDNGGNPAAELLENNGADEGFKAGLAVLDGERAGSGNDFRQDGVFFEMLKGSTHNETRSRTVRPKLISV